MAFFDSPLRPRHAWILFSSMVGAALAIPASGQESPLEEPTPGAARQPAANPGAALYALHCAACHGERGDGKGMAAAYVFPKPRDFTAGKFRLVSTSNSVPSRDDLHAVLLRGMPGSSMPPWKHLSQAERDALVDEVMRLRSEGAKAQYVQVLKDEVGLSDEEIAADDMQQEIRDFVVRFTTPGKSTAVPKIGEPTQDSIAAARETYAKFGCLQCHGDKGKGDGVKKMVDGEGLPITPRDFTAGVFKGGADPQSLYRRIFYGMPGTPMPSASQMTPEQVIDLVHYIRSMSTEEQRQAAILNRETIVVKRTATIPAGLRDPGWDTAPAVSIRMTPLWWRNEAVPQLQVQAVHDGQSIAVRLSWHDETPDLHSVRGETFEDAVALGLYRGSAEPFPGMGDPRTPIDVWFWDADRQLVVDVEDQYPNVVVDLYPFAETQAATPEFRREGTRLVNQPEISLPALATGNQIAPGRAASGGSNLSVAGPGSMTFRLPRSQHVVATGDWKDGRWTVYMTRPLALPTADDGVPLAAGARVSAAFAVWDGSQHDRDGKKLITIWQDLKLEK